MRVLIAFYGGCLAETIMDADVNRNSPSDPLHPAVQCYQVTDGKVGSRFWIIPEIGAGRQFHRISRFASSGTTEMHTLNLGGTTTAESLLQPQQYEIIERLDYEGTFVLVAEHCCDQLVDNE